MSQKLSSVSKRWSAVVFGATLSTRSSALQTIEPHVTNSIRTPKSPKFSRDVR